MKKLIFLYFVILSTSICFGQTYLEKNGGPYCVEIGIRTLNIRKTLQENEVIILEGYRSKQDIISNLNKKYPVYLKSKSKIVKLQVVEYLVGRVYINQVVLKPLDKLEVGEEYELYIDSLPKKTHKFEFGTNPKWTIISQFDTIEPKWLILPKLISKQRFIPQCSGDFQFPCRDFESIVFETALNYSSSILIKVTIENIKTNDKTMFYIRPDENKIEIGHNECFGAFEFGKENKFKATFDILDLSNGKLVTWNKEKIEFNTFEMSD